VQLESKNGFHNEAYAGYTIFVLELNLDFLITINVNEEELNVRLLLIEFIIQAVISFIHEKIRVISI
jgi:hypothetical protein